MTPDIVGQIGKETAQEALAAHIHSSWSPVLDVARDVRWGRVEETYGESPYLVSRMGVSWIEAFQALNMIAVPKHFAGHGEPLGGRDSNDAGLSDRILREIHLPSFRAAVEEAHAGGVMAAYSTWHGVPDNASTDLLQRVLRQEWGFDGYVVSDCGALDHFITKHGVASTEAQAAALGAAAGVNMNCGNIYKQGMAKALEQGLVTPEELDGLVRPILRAKFKLGLFEHPESDKVSFDKIPAYDTPAARALARQVEVEGAVLLENDNNILPLSKSAKKIAVIGPNADLGQTGDYSPKPLDGQLITVLQGIKSHAGPNTQVVYAPGLDSPLSLDTSKFDDAVNAAKGADVAVVVVGDNSHPGGGPSTTGENNDGATLDFPGKQRELIRAIQATGTPVVLVIVNGKPFTLAWEAENIPGILVTWYPGEEGGDATADLLFGDKNPSGRLPLTWPRDVGQLPLHYDYTPSGRKYDYYDLPASPQYRFGYGLSYTQFKYSNLQITPKADDPGFVTVSADVQNTGNYDGDDVVQLYFTDLVATVDTPVCELGGFQRISLKKGETKTVTFQLTPYQLSLLDANMIRRVEPGTFRIHVGGSSPTLPKGVSDDRKAKIGFDDPSEGVSGQFTESKAYAARFVYTLDAPDKVGGGAAFPATLTVKNEGNLTDITLARLFDGFQLDTWGFELNPGETKTHVFHPAVYQSGDLAVVGETQMVGKTIEVEKAPARLDLKNIRTSVDDNEVLQASIDAQNVGGDPYAGAVSLKIDGQPAESDTLKLQPGEKQHVVLSHTFAIGGIHSVQVNDQPAQQIVVPGGLGLALGNPLIDLKLDEGQGSTAKNEITGTNFDIKGSPAWVEGHEGQALQLTQSGMDVDVGNVDIYRKAFTLSAWVKIDQLGQGDDLALFGGKAPMGADQDNTGTILHVGVQHKKAFMGFLGRDIHGKKDVPLGKWINLTYTYDPEAEKGSVYIDGSLDQESDQKPYTGPLETIGDAPELQHGSYALDDAVVAQSCMTPNMVKLLVGKGLDSLRGGEYISDWETFAGAPTQLAATADIPAGSKIEVNVDVGSDGKGIGSKKIELQSGTQTYPLDGMTAGNQVRIRVEISSTDWKALPVLRSAVLTGGGATQRWSTPSQWGAGKAEPSLITNYGQP